jgi:hypothetical protein
VEEAGVLDRQEGRRPKEDHSHAELGGLAAVRERVQEAGERVDPKAERGHDAEEGDRRLDDQVGHRPPPDAVAQDRLEPSEEARTVHERWGVLDLLVEQAPGDVPMEPAPAPGPAHGEADDREANEGDGQRDARRHGDTDEHQADGGHSRADDEEQDLGPGPLRERCAQDGAGHLADPGLEVFWDHDHHL